jgi:RNA polymerase sigma-70 factor (ECF subfamily)
MRLGKREACAPVWLGVKRQDGLGREEDAMTDHDAALAELSAARRQFLALVEDVRPELHRYCARMTGSVFDGEDIVQDTLARAYYELSALKQLPALRSWLFRIAHNRALDFLRRYDRRMREPFEGLEPVAGVDSDPEDALIREEALFATLTRFLELPPVQRSCVILKDVLGHSLEEISSLLELSVPAVKAALHRGRTRLRAQAETAVQAPRQRRLSPVITRYAELFNARDWDGVRALLVEDVKLDVVSQLKRTGRREVDLYFTNYSRWTGWRVETGWVDGRVALIVKCEPPASKREYFVEIATDRERITAIRDFGHIPYIARDATVEFGRAESQPSR